MALSEDTLDIIQKYFPEDIGTVKKLSSIPGFDDELNAGFQNAINETRTLEGYDPSGGNFLKQNIEAALTNPTEYVLKAMRNGVRSAVNQADSGLLTKQIEYLKQNNVPLDTIQTRYTEHAAKQAAFDARNVELKAQQGGGFFGRIGQGFAQLDKDLGLSQNAVPIAALAALAASGGLAGVGIPGLGAAGAGAAGTAAAADLAAAYGATGAGVGAGTAAGIGAGVAGTAAAADLAAAYGGSGAGVGASTAAGTNALAAGNVGANALAAQTAVEASSPVPLAGAGTAAGTGALASQIAAEGSSAVPLAGAGAAAAAGAMPSWMTPAAIVGSSLIGANAAQTAAKTQSDAAAQANQLLAQQYATQRADLAPFTAAGVGAQNKLLTFLGLPGGTAGADFGKYTKDFTGADLLAGQDPGYGFRLSEGQKALERSAAARGGLLSGNTGKALTSYGQQMGSQEYQNAYNRYQTNRANQLAPLFTLTGSGQASAAGQAAAAGNYATGAANNLTSAGAARAAGDVGSANALTSGLGSYLNYSGQQDLLAAYNERTRQSAYRS